MNLVRFTFANIFDFKSVMDACYTHSGLHSSNSDRLIIVFKYYGFTGPYIRRVNSICTPTNIEELHE